MKKELLVIILLIVPYQCFGMFVRRLSIIKPSLSNSYSTAAFRDLLERDPSAAILTARNMQQWLDEEEEQIENIIEEPLNSSNLFNECHKMYSSYKVIEKEFLEDSYTCTNEKINTLFKSICCSLAIDQKKMSLLESPNNSSYGCSFSSFVKIHPTLPKRPEEIQHYILTRELRHIANKDSMSKFIASRILNKEEKEDLEKFYRLSRFQIIRADVETAQQSITCAQGLIETTKNLMFDAQISNATTHPLDITRFFVGIKILREFHNLTATKNLNRQ